MVFNYIEMGQISDLFSSKTKKKKKVLLFVVCFDHPYLKDYNTHNNFVPEILNLVQNKAFWDAEDNTQHYFVLSFYVFQH